MTVGRATLLTTRRLRFTTWIDDDLDDLCRLHADPVTMQYVRHGRPDTRDECAALLATYLTEQTSGWAKWRLIDTDGRMMGRAGFGSHDGARALSYVISRERWGEGLATEVGSALIAWHGANNTDGSALCAHAAVANPASARVLVKLGFTRCGQEVLAGELCDAFVLEHITAR